ncbi:hypothetical protein AX769_20460 [Frondihabitans sp. PAMC 28766]|nr:hypothetical protein AX769_20460 [Frondihabitans sp. PAMC 28766]
MPALVGLGVAAVAIVAVIGLATSGFRQETVCSAVGYAPLLVVTITGDPAAVHDVRVCTTGGCSAPAAAALARWAADANSSSVQETPAATPASPPSGRSSAVTVPSPPTGPETPAPARPPGSTSASRPGSGWTGTTTATPGVEPAPQFSPFADTVPARWGFSGVGGRPPAVGITAYGADGRALASRVATLDWHELSPGSACPTPVVPGPVRLRVGR